MNQIKTFIDRFQIPWNLEPATSSFIDSRYRLFFDRSLHQYVVYKPISLASVAVLKKFYWIKENLSRMMVHMYSLPVGAYPGDWLYWLFRKTTFRETESLERSMNTFLAELDSPDPWEKDNAFRCAELQREMAAGFSACLRERCSMILDPSVNMYRRKKMTKDILFVGARSGKVLGRVNKKTKKFYRSDGKTFYRKAGN